MMCKFFIALDAPQVKKNNKNKRNLFFLGPINKNAGKNYIKIVALKIEKPQNLWGTLCLVKSL